MTQFIDNDCIRALGYNLRKSRDQEGEFFVATKDGQFKGYIVELHGTMMRGTNLKETREDIGWYYNNNPWYEELTPNQIIKTKPIPPMIKFRIEFLQKEFTEDSFCKNTEVVLGKLELIGSKIIVTGKEEYDLTIRFIEYEFVKSDGEYYYCKYDQNKELERLEIDEELDELEEDTFRI